MFRKSKGEGNNQTKVTKCKYCQTSLIWLEIPASLNTYGKTKRLPYAIDPQGRNTGTVHKCSVGLAAWEERRKQQEEKDRQAGRSRTMPCPRCSRPIYWSYTRLSRNSKPLPLNDDGTEEYHQCPFYEGKK